MSAVGALLFAVFFASTASAAFHGGNAFTDLIVYRFASRDFSVMPESRHFPPNKAFIKPDAYSPDRETVVYIHGSDLYDPDTIYTQEIFIDKGYLRVHDCNMITVFWNLLIPKNATQGQLFDTATQVGINTADMLLYLKSNYGGTTLRLVGFDYGVKVAMVIIDSISEVFPVEYFTALSPYWSTGGDSHFKRNAVKLFQVVYSSIEAHKVLPGDRTYFINDGKNQPGCPQKPKNISVNCKRMQSLINYFLSLNTGDPIYDVTHCSSFKDFKAGKCNYQPKIQLYNDVAQSDLPKGDYFGNFNSSFEPAFEQYWERM